MAPFIKYREQKAGTAGDAEHLKFVNAAHIRSADYDVNNRTLSILLTQDGVPIRITGDDAEAALKVLQAL